MELINQPTFKDNRGSYTPIPLNALGKTWDQCSISINDKAWTFRGLHYQENPRQEKLVKVLSGSICDFAMDLETGQVEWAIVNDQEAVLIGPDKAHGFLTLAPGTIVAYLVNGEWNPAEEKSIPYHQVEEVTRLINSIASFAEGEEITVSEKDMIGK
jgi:dTDP-4-dehydrorhamnose 3,5-epimerase-like enzyme